MKRFLCLVSLLCLISLPLIAQDNPVRMISGGFSYNQYAANGSLPIEVWGSISQQLAGPLYTFTSFGVTGTPVPSPDGSFKMPTLQFTPRTGALLHTYNFGRLSTFLIGDIGVASTASWTARSMTAGGGGSFKIKDNWSIPVIFRAVNTAGQPNQYVVEIGVSFMSFK